MAIIEDFDREAYRIDEVLTELLGPPSEDELVPDGSARQAKGRPAPVAVAPVEPGTTELQLTWEPGSIIAWAAGKDAPADDVAGRPEEHTSELQALMRHSFGVF